MKARQGKAKPIRPVKLGRFIKAKAVRVRRQGRRLVLDIKR